MNNPKKLQFGLNIVSKKAKISQNLKKNSSIFQADADDDEEVVVKSTTTDQLRKKQAAGTALVNEDIQRIQERTEAKAAKLQKLAMEEDASIFDYDGVYDTLKKEEILQKRLRDGVDPNGSTHKKARYMADLIKSANERKLYLEKASERRLQKEREEEGGEFGDKEEFVTEAYLERQREIKRLEEEQRKLDEQESDPHRERDMTGFYRGLLDKVERKAPLILGDKSMASKDASADNLNTAAAEEDVKEDMKIHSGVVLNDNMEVVDKRQLLTGGLNLTSKAKKKQIQEEKDREEEQKRREAQAKLDRERRLEEQKRQEVLRKQQERNRSMVLSQKMLVEKEQSEKKEKEEAEKIEMLTKTTVTKETVSDARARYLARKAQAAEANKS